MHVEWGLGPIKGTYRKISESRVLQVFQIVLVSQGLFQTIQQYFLCILLRMYALLPFLVTLSSYGLSTSFSRFYLLTNNKTPHKLLFWNQQYYQEQRTNRKRNHLCSVCFWIWKISSETKHHVLHLRDQVWRLLSQISMITWYSGFWKITALHNIIINCPTVQPYWK